MDQAIRNKLRSVVTQGRRLLEDSIARQLQGESVEKTLAWTESEVEGFLRT